MLRFPRVLWVVVGLSIALALPSLFADFYSDDQSMVLTIEGIAPAPIPGPFHLYTFMSGAPGERDLFVAQSQLPWWTVDRARLSFCRPLSSALLTLDHWIAGRHPLFYHAHSIAWYAAAAFAGATLFRRLLPKREAALAALLFVVSPAHWMLAAWPSARHVAISGTLAIAALILHIQARERSAARPGLLQLAALVCAALALAGGETALGVFGYVAAYELLGRRDPLTARLRALLPWAALLGAYAIQYKTLGYGVRGVGGYIDPIVQPLAYLSVLPARLAVYLGAALLCVPSEISLLAPIALPILVALGIAASATFAALLKRAWRMLTPELARTLTWLLGGALLATLPGVASIPGDRVLFLPNLAVTAALASVLLRAGKAVKSATLTLISRVGVAFYGFVHVVLAPLSFAYGANQLASTSHAAFAAASRAEIPARLDVHVIGIGLSDPLVGMYLPAALYIAPRPEPRPAAVQLLSMSGHDHRVERTGDRTLELTVLDGALLDGGLESLFRPASAPLHAGDVEALGTWTVRILDQKQGRPTRFSLELDRSVDDPTITLLVWRDGALRALAPPRVGESVLVRHERGPIGL